MCLPKEEGGLGIKDNSCWNLSQILFHLCMVISKKNSLWVSWIHNTALKNRDFWTMLIPAECSWIWRQVLKLRPLAVLHLVYRLDNRNNIFWGDTNLRKIKTWNIWDSIRIKGSLVSWWPFIWNKLSVPRFAFNSWLLCLGRVQTLSRLLSFGINTSISCLFCASGIETSSHLFLHCPYSGYILQHLSNMLHCSFDDTSWINLLSSINLLKNCKHRLLGFLVAQTFVHHIWSERNTRLHGSSGCPPSVLLLRIIKGY